MTLELKKEYIEKQKEKEDVPAKNHINPYQLSEEDKKIRNKGILYGSFWLIGGLIASGISYSAVPDQGGTYFVFWGAVIYGGYRVLASIL